MSFKKLHRDEPEQDWPDSRRRRRSAPVKRFKGKRICFLMPGKPPRSLACHLTAGPGHFTEDPLRVTCDFCQNKPNFKSILHKRQCDMICKCSHRRGQHLGKEGLGRCILCVPCQGFEQVDNGVYCVSSG